MPERQLMAWRDILLELLLAIDSNLDEQLILRHFLPVLLRKLGCQSVAVFRLDEIVFDELKLIKELPRHSGIPAVMKDLPASTVIDGQSLSQDSKGTVYAYRLPDYGVLCIKHTDLPEIFQNEMRHLCQKLSHSLLSSYRFFELQHSKQQLDRFFSLSDNLMCVINPAFYFVKVNPAFQKILGYSLDDFYSRPLYDFTHPDDWKCMQELLSSSNQQSGRTRLQVRFKHTKGHDVDLLWELAHDMLSGCFYGSAIDIRERVALEQNLRNAKLAAEEMAQAKSDFLANMSHEIRTPLNGVLGMLDLVLQQPIKSDARTKLQTAYKSGLNLLAIVNDVLDFSKINAHKLQLESIPFHIPTLIEHLQESFSHQAIAKSLQFSISEKYDGGKWFLGDPFRIQQIITNLLSNALKFTHHGSIELSVATTPAETAHHVRFSVSDSGVGMKDATQSTIFNAFTQADSSTTRQYGGTGLGLSICKSLADLMGGDLSVVSQLGKGTKFSLSVMLPVAAPFIVNESDASETTADRLTAHVLIVEDNEINLQIAEANLIKLGCTVKAARNGLEAIQLLQHSEAGSLDLVIMDCLMPEMDGYEATRVIRQGGAGAEWKNIPILALTANAMREDRMRCAEAGMNDYLAKPFKREALLHHLKKLISRSHQNSLLPKELETHPQINTELGVIGDLEQWNKEKFDNSFQGMESLGQELLALFKKQLPDIMSQLKNAIECQDYTTVKRLAHSLKGSSAQLHFTALSEQAKKVEEAVKNGEKINVNQSGQYLTILASNILET